jgi:hypothetical protein
MCVQLVELIPHLLPRRLLLLLELYLHLLFLILLELYLRLLFLITALWRNSLLVVYLRIAGVVSSTRSRLLLLGIFRLGLLFRFQLNLLSARFGSRLVRFSTWFCRCRLWISLLLQLQFQLLRLLLRLLLQLQLQRLLRFRFLSLM